MEKKNNLAELAEALTEQRTAMEKTINAFNSLVADFNAFQKELEKIAAEKGVKVNGDN
jgi:uncharacterized coiled-coil protein SlyX